jgi:hypothetical protein
MASVDHVAATARTLRKLSAPPALSFKLAEHMRSQFKSRMESGEVFPKMIAQ